MANGRVLTGFSYPYVAVYSNAGTTITYTSATTLARGVSVSLDVEDAGDDNVFYADNVAAESIEGTFTGGTVTLTVDGLFPTSEALIYGLSSADGDGFVNYGANQTAPYIGIGFVCRYMSAGSTTYVPVVLTKCKFNPSNLSANTQEEDIEWQTQELTARVMRDDSADLVWKKVGTATTTEASAITMITSALS